MGHDALWVAVLCNPTRLEIFQSSSRNWAETAIFITFAVSSSVPIRHVWFCSGMDTGENESQDSGKLRWSLLKCWWKWGSDSAWSLSDLMQLLIIGINMRKLATLGGCDRSCSALRDVWELSLPMVWPVIAAQVPPGLLLPCWTQDLLILVQEVMATYFWSSDRIFPPPSQRKQL